MIRILLILIPLGLLFYGISWLVKNRVRLTMHRAPTGREIFLISMAIRALKTLLRILLRA